MLCFWVFVGITFEVVGFTLQGVLWVLVVFVFGVFLSVDDRFVISLRGCAVLCCVFCFTSF